MTASSSSSTQPSSAETAQQIKGLLKEIPEERADAARLDELRRFFGRLVTSGDLIFSSSSNNERSSHNDDASSKWKAFLRKQHSRMVTQLCQRIHSNTSHKRTAVRTLWGVIAASPMIASNQVHRHVHPDLVYQWIRSMTIITEEEESSTTAMDKTLRHMVEQEFLHPYRDVQYYALVAIARIATDGYHNSGSLQETEAERLLQLLFMIPIPTTQAEMDQSNYLFPPVKTTTTTTIACEDSGDDDSGDEESSLEEEEGDSSEDDEQEKEETSSRKRKRQEEQQKNKNTKKRMLGFAFQQLRSHRKALADAWLAVLKLPLPLAALKHALQFLPQHVLPHVPHALHFSDFFIQAYNGGNTTASAVAGSGVTSLLALDGLFTLMTQHGLEHPRFYESLYKLVKPEALYAKHRTRFLELLAKCLCRNEMLPAHVVASFVKRLLRTTLNSPPPGTLFVLALCSQLLRQHPECACLIHRGSCNGESSKVTDAFDPHTDDPSQTRVLESSLWELSALSQHYYPAVATLAKSIGTESDKTPLYNLDDFLRHTYKSLFDQERKRSDKTKKRKLTTPLTFVEPRGLFDKDDVFANVLSVIPQEEEEATE